MKVTAKAQRSGEWWAIEVLEVAGIFTEVRRLDQVAEQVADAVAILLDVSAGDVEVELAPEAAKAQVVFSRSMRTTVRQLRASELSVRDVAVLLGVSHQRLAQLEKRQGEH